MYLKRKLILFFLSVTSISCMSNVLDKDEIVVNLKDKGADIPSSMYGVFFEEINHAGDGGLYAELVCNRSFEELEMPEGYRAEKNKLIPAPKEYHLTGEVRLDRSYRWTEEEVPGWYLQVADKSDAKMRITKYQPKFEAAPNNLEVTIDDASQSVRLVNKGYWGMNIQKGEKYTLRVILRAKTDYLGGVKACLLSSEGKVMASAPIKLDAKGEWNDVELTLEADVTDPKAVLALEFDAPGTVWFDYVSLFPEKTFNNRPNGLRQDVAEMLVGLQPAFVRWPGGCVVEGITLENRFEWKKTLGDPAARPGEYSTWGYRCSYGFGYYEMLQFCEDIGAKAMYVCNVGLGCQFRMGDACEESEIGYYIDDCMDAIEYAIGDSTTEWGARRIEDGHPAPFPLQYVEIGNENWGPEYDKRFDLFYKAIKEKYPQLTLIYNEMPQREGAPSIERTDMIDPHWYVDPYFFLRNTTLFDSYERGKYTVYVGEYACNRGVGGGNMLGALAEAAFIGGMERNGDLVKMASYAPLLENRHDRSWTTNLIWLDTDKVMGRSSYYVQKMAAQNRPDYNVKSSITTGKAETLLFNGGYVGFGASSASVEFDDIKITRQNKEYIPGGDSWIIKTEGLKPGDVDGRLCSDRGKLALLKDVQNDEYTLSCRVRKTAGEQGFQFFLNMDEDGMTGYRFNIGMWSSNDRAELIRLDNNRDRGVLSEHSGKKIEIGKWYDVQIKVSPKKCEFYLDGECILSYIPQPMPLQFIASGYDKQKKELVLKVVNASDSTYNTKIKLEGADNVLKTGKVIRLVADKETDENSFDNPKKIYPQELEYDRFGKEFEYEFSPLSYTILRIKAEIDN